MDPKEKARVLVKKYYNFVSGWTSTNRPGENPSAQYDGEKMKIGRAKQCALIAIDEILDENHKYDNFKVELTSKLNEQHAFWTLVRAEVNAL